MHNDKDYQVPCTMAKIIIHPAQWQGLFGTIHKFHCGRDLGIWHSKCKPLQVKNISPVGEDHMNKPSGEVRRKVLQVKVTAKPYR